MDIPATPAGPAEVATTSSLASLVENHLSIVDDVIAELEASWPNEVDRQEMASAGRVGLVEASRAYEPERGQPFAHEARLRVRGAVLDAVRDAGWAPRGVHARAEILRAARAGLTDELGRSPTTEELAEACGAVAAELRRNDGDGVRAGLLRRDDDKSVAGIGSDASLVTLLLSPATGAEQRSGDFELRVALGDALAELDNRDRVVVYGLCLEGRSTAEVARDLSLADHEVTDTARIALAHLNQVLRDEWLRVHGFDYGNADRPEQRARGYAEAMRRYHAWYEERRHQFA